MKLKSLDKFVLYYEDLAFKVSRSIKKPKRRLKHFFLKKRNQHKLGFALCGVIIAGLIAGLIISLSHNADISYKNQIEKKTYVEQLSGLNTRLKLVEKAKTSTKSELKQKQATIAELKADREKLKKKYSRLMQTKAEQKTLASATAYTEPTVNAESYETREVYSSSGNTYSPGFCTWGVKNWRPDLPNSLGDAYLWYSRAQALGMSTGTSPQVGAVGVTKAYSHVVLITGISGSTVTVKEMNYNGLYVTSSRTAPASEFSYIY